MLKQKSDAHTAHKPQMNEYCQTIIPAKLSSNITNCSK